MSDKIALTIDVTPEQRERIEHLAHQHGFDTPSEYLLSLVESDLEVDEEETKEQILEEFRQGWRAAMNGETIPASELSSTLHIKGHNTRSKRACRRTVWGF
jgi:hypothetical protein